MPMHSLPMTSPYAPSGAVQFPGLLSNKHLFFQSFLMIIAQGHLAIIVRTTRTNPTTVLVIDRLRPAQNRFMRRCKFIWKQTWWIGMMRLEIIFSESDQNYNRFSYVVHSIARREFQGKIAKMLWAEIATLEDNSVRGLSVILILCSHTWKIKIIIILLS